jgi:tetratricopeptide (TPR) repeat protein
MSQEQAKHAATSDAVATGDESDGAPKSTSFARFARDVGIIAILLGGGAFAYNKHVTVKEQVNEITVKARDLMKKNDLPSLIEAEKQFNEILALDADNGSALAWQGLGYYYQSEYGLPTKDKAQQFAVQARNNGGTDSQALYGVEAYLQIRSGNPAQAEKDIRALLEKDIAAPMLAHALGWALAEKGDVLEGDRIMRQSTETDFSAVYFRLTLAEISHRQGNEKDAIKQLDTIIRDNMNPKHQLARAWLAALRLKNFGNLTGPANHIKAVADSGDQGPRTKAMLAWAEGELALAVGNADGALKKVDEVLGILNDYPPAYDLKARALLGMKKPKEALEAYEKAASLKPDYRSIKWDLAKIKSENKDDGALVLIEELEKTATEKGPEYEIFRGDHFLRKGKLNEAKDAYTKAADLGDDAAILFGFARVTFEEEKSKGKKADIEKVGEQLSQTLEKKSTYPEVHQFLGDISLWNFMVDGASAEYEQAEQQYKKQKKPITQLVRFYDQVIKEFGDVEDKGAKKEADKKADDWKKKKAEYLASVVSEQG